MTMLSGLVLCLVLVQVHGTCNTGQELSLRKKENAQLKDLYSELQKCTRLSCTLDGEKMIATREAELMKARRERDCGTELFLF